MDDKNLGYIWGGQMFSKNEAKKREERAKNKPLEYDFFRHRLFLRWRHEDWQRFKRGWTQKSRKKTFMNQEITSV